MLAKSFLVVMISEIIYNFSGYVIQSGMGRILGPADYGRYGLIVTTTTMIVVLIGNGIPTAMSKYLSEIFQKKPGLVPVIKRKAALAQFILIGATSLIFYLITPWIAEVLGDSSLISLFRISVFIIPAFALASFYFSYYTGIHQFRVQAFLKILRSVARIVFILGLAWLLKSRGLALKGSIIGYILSPLIVFLGAQLFNSFRHQKTEGNFSMKKLFNYAWPVTLFMLAYEFLITVDLYLVKIILHSDYLTGIYNAVITIGRIPYYLFYALTIILLPAVSHSTSNENQVQTQKIVSESLRLMVIFLAPICILMSTFANPIVQIFYSKRFLEAGGPMSIFVYGIGFLTVFYIFTFILNGAGKVYVPMTISFVGLLFNSLVTFFLIKKYALWGGVLGTTITSFLVMVAILIYAYRYFGYLFQLSRFLKIMLASGIMFLLAQFFPNQDFTFFIWSAILFGAYLAILFGLKEIGTEEWQFLLETLKRKKKQVPKVE